MIVYSRPIIGKDTEGNLKSLQLTGPDRNLLQIYDGYNKILLEKILHELKLLNFNINIIAENDNNELIGE
mgnify:CR=1 FL=1